MIKKLITFASVIMMTLPLLGQRPTNIVLNGKANLETSIDLRSVVECADNDVGVISRPPDLVTFLCFGDQISLEQIGTPVLNGDPNPTPTSRAGIGYAFYDSPPTIDGPDLTTVLTDPSLNTTSPIIIGGFPVPQTDGIWVAPSDDGIGGLTITNDGFIQNAYNNGDPIQFWFAPITVDSLPIGFDKASETSPNGPCVTVGINQAFSIVYLNEITITTPPTTTTTTNCIAQMVIEGGLPEFDDTANYTITATLQSDPSITADVPDNLGHGELVEFQVPQPGIYDIVIEDGNGCPAVTTLDASACRSITLNLPNLNALPGQTDVCLDLTVEDFTDVGIVQFSINWDETVLSFNSIQNFDTNLPGAQPGLTETALGQLTFSWPTTPLVADLPDGTAILTICFDVIGQLGDESPVEITGTPTDIEFSEPNNLDPLGVIINNGQVNISSANIFLDVDGQDPNCFNDPSGVITVTIAGGTPPYQVTYENNITNEIFGPFDYPDGLPQLDLDNVLAGEYTVDVQDSGTETAQALITLNNPLDIGARLIVTDPQCFGDSIQQITVQVIEGTSIVSNPETRFTFTWDTPFGNNLSLGSEVQNVPVGQYTVQVMDMNGCTGVAAEAIPSPSEIIIPVANVNITDATCSGARNGNIVVTATGGNTATGAYTYDWDNGFSETSIQSTNPNLDPGNYVVTITDDNGCSVVDSSFIVSANKIFTLTTDPVDITCFGEGDGTVFTNVVASGPTAAILPFNFNWTDESGNPINPDSITTNGSAGTSSVVGLSPGTYFVTAEDGDPAGCSISGTIEITEPDSLDVTLFGTTVETCTNGFGSMDATATIEVTGGTFPYDYIWTNTMMDTVSQDSAAMMLSADTLVARVMDINGCLDTLEVLVGSLPAPTITSLPTDFLDCSTDTEGSLSVSIDPNGVQAASIEWFDANGSRVGNGENANNLPPGGYFVNILGVNECGISDSTTVLAPEPIRVDSININNTPSCPGDNNGQFAVFASGGTEPYSYTWSNDPNNPVDVSIQTGFTAGTFGVTVTDANNCDPAIGTATMEDPPSILVNFANIGSTTCFNSTDGTAMANATYSDGSIGNFNFLWESGERSANNVTSTASQLPRDSVRLLVDDGTCIDSFFVDIPSPTDIEIFVDERDITCNGFNDGSIDLTVNGGTIGAGSDYAYNWASGQTTSSIAGLAEGMYEVEIMDDNGCTKTQFASITEPRALALQVNEAFTEDVTCNGDDDGEIVLLSTGGTVGALGNDGYSYTWSDGNILEERMDLSPGIYFVTVTDINGCQDSISHVVNEPAPISATIMTPEPPICFGDPTQLVILDVTGGNATTLDDYRYIVNNNNIEIPVTEPAIIFPIVNSYTVLDNNNCSFTDTISVPEAPRLDVVFDPLVQVVELGDTLVLRPQINAAPDRDLTYSWSPGGNLSATDVENPVIEGLLDDINNLRLTVTDQFGCTTSASVNIELDANRNVYIPNAFSPDGNPEGSVFNDVFSVYACKGVSEIVSARIFDRWGEVIYEDANITPVTCDEDRPGIGTPLWDGTYKGQPMNPGTFAYTIEVQFLDNVTLIYRGTFHLLR